MTSAKRPTGLGRGLSALLGDLNAAAVPAPAEARVSAAGPDGSLTPLDLIDANPHQPRRHFDETALNELADSIRTHGLIQPLLVRPVPGGRFQLVAGERRWRAAQIARIHRVPVVVRSLDDDQTLQIALIENIQRQDLNPIEEAEGYLRLTRDFGHPAAAIGQLVGKSRAHVANLIRLLDLPELVRTWLADGSLQMGHARALITTAEPVTLARRVIAEGLSVRATERLAAGQRKAGAASGGANAAPRDADTRALEDDLAARLGLKVNILHKGGQGQVTIHYGSLDQLDDLCRRLSATPASGF